MPASTVNPNDRRAAAGSLRGWHSVLGRLLALLVLIALAVSPWPAAVSHAAPAPPIWNAIAAVNARFVQAFDQHNAAAVAALYTEDGAILPPNFPMISGRAGIQAFWQGAIDLGATSATPTSTEVELLGNTATEVGEYALFAGTEQIDAGKYIVIWKSVRGKWMLFRDIWNTSLPAAG